MFEVGEKSGDRRVGFAGKLPVVAGNIDVAVPTPFIRHATAVNLNEPGAAFDEPARHQALPGKVGASLIVHTIQGADGLGFAGNVEGFGSRHLHAVGQFEALDSGSQLGFFAACIQKPMVEVVD